MAGGLLNFEIQALRSERWITEEYRDNEQAARAAAAGILKKPTCQGARIVKNWQRGDGSTSETVIFTETSSGPKEIKVNIVPIEDAPYCRETGDYYRADSRATINRLLRKYIEQVMLTPTELLHNYKALSKVQQVDTLFPAAVDRVASITAPAAKVDSRVRRDQIYHAVTEMANRARRAEQRQGLPALKGRNFDAVIDRLGGVVGPDEADYYALVVLSRDLCDRRNWLAKLERLVELLQPGHPSEQLLDGVIADIVGVPAALQDLLGFQRNLAHALCAIADLAEGKVPEASEAAQQLAVVAPLLAEGRLPETRRALMDRLLRQLTGGQPLNRIEPTKEREAFQEMAAHMLRPSGLLGGPAMAEALTRRFALQLQEGGKAGLTMSIGGIVSLMTDSGFRIAYLLALAETPFGVEQSSQIVRLLRQTVRVPAIDELVPRGWSPKDKLQHVTRLYSRIADCGALTEEDRKPLLDGLDMLLAGYLKRERIVERLDDPELPLHSRTVRLLEFCAARLLPPGSRAHSVARARVVDLLRQPNFEQHFVEGVTDGARCEAMLRELHGLMARGGFR